jgi:hypothetical protein
MLPGSYFHTAAYWLMHRAHAAIRSAHPLARAEFATIRERLIGTASCAAQSDDVMD